MAVFVWEARLLFWYRHHIRYVLSGNRGRGHNGHAEAGTDPTETAELKEPSLHSTSTEVRHV